MARRHELTILAQQSVEGAFRVGARAGLVELLLAVNADQNSSGKRGHAVLLLDGPGINTCGEVDFEIGEKCVDAILLFLSVNAQQQEGLRLVRVEVRIQLRHLLAARAAPSSKEVEHNDFLADVVGELKAF